MRTDFYYDSCGVGKIHACVWTPEQSAKAVVQIIHGIAEYAERYDRLANYLNEHGYLVVAEDHMGHGKSIGKDGVQGWFSGGWMNAVEDSYRLMQDTMAQNPGLPYILFGHSMGSFMARTLLYTHPDSGIAGAVICGTGWMPGGVLTMGQQLAKVICRISGEKKPSDLLQGMMFGGYNQRVEHPRTSHDWLSRDNQVVDAYVADPLCGFVPSAGLVRDMMGGMIAIQKQENLEQMNPDLPVFFIAGGDDPVGGYGKGVRQAAGEFQKAGMKDVALRIYPLCRHEIHNEINREEVYEDLVQWMDPLVKKE